ncbi:MAG TPA: GNAT family N-acetyltransferase [Trebonia sp.]
MRDDDIDAVVEFSVRAWRPVFESFMEVMGPDIFRRIYPHWQAGQAAAVRDACRDEAHRTWVAEAPETHGAPETRAEGTRPIAFVVVAVHDDPRRGEIYMIAVDPDYQNRGIGLALVNFATDRIIELGLPLAEIGTGGDRGHAPARHVYEKAGFTPVPLVHYYKALPPAGPPHLRPLGVDLASVLCGYAQTEMTLGHQSPARAVNRAGGSWRGRSRARLICQNNAENDSANRTPGWRP